MKKKLILMGIAGALALTTMIGGTLAAFQANSSQGTSDITTKDLNICISDGETKELDKYQSGVVKAMPGSTINEDLKVAFAEENNYDSYVRVTIYKAWGEKNANGEFAKDFDGTLDLAAIEILPEQEDDWIVIQTDDETTTMYYKKPISEAGAKRETSKFIDEIRISNEIGNQYANKSFVIEASAEAVQTVGGAEAVRSAWGVSASMDPEGIITGITVE